MSMVAAKCSECGASIEVNSERKEGYCPFCGTKYMAQDVIQNTVNNNYVTNNIGTAIIQGGDTIDAMYERLEAFIRLGDLTSADNAVNAMRKKFPQKALTWYCAALYEEERIEDEFKRAHEKIDDYVNHVQFPELQEVQKVPEEIRDVGKWSLEGIERMRPTSASIDISNAKQMLDAAHKFETAEDRSRYSSLIRRVEDGVSGHEQKVRAFDDYVASAYSEVKTRADAWCASTKKYLRRKKLKRCGIVVAILVVVAAVICFIVI